MEITIEVYKANSIIPQIKRNISAEQRQYTEAIEAPTIDGIDYAFESYVTCNYFEDKETGYADWEFCDYNLLGIKAWKGEKEVEPENVDLREIMETYTMSHLDKINWEKD